MQRRALSAVIALAVGSMAAQAAPIIINHASRDTSGYSQQTMERAAEMRVFFSHASVGGNLCGGLDMLGDADPTRFKLNTQSLSSSSPIATSAGALYHYSRGNPEPKDKVDWFANYIDAGWGDGRVDVAINKFCYIDYDADFAYYRDSMLTLEAAHPETTFVYVTVPLKVASESSSAKTQASARQQFNDALRAFCMANDKVLYDLADIEAYDSSGVEHTMDVNGVTVQVLADEWTQDGGHLYYNGRQYAAEGLYALLAEVAVAPEPTSLSLLILGLVLRRR